MKGPPEPVMNGLSDEAILLELMQAFPGKLPKIVLAVEADESERADCHKRRLVVCVPDLSNNVAVLRVLMKWQGCYGHARAPTVSAITKLLRQLAERTSGPVRPAALRQLAEALKALVGFCRELAQRTMSCKAKCRFVAELKQLALAHTGLNNWAYPGGKLGEAAELAASPADSSSAVSSSAVTFSPVTSSADSSSSAASSSAASSRGKRKGLPCYSFTLSFMRTKSAILLQDVFDPLQSLPSLLCLAWQVLRVS
jgi:hypothetical protein